MSNSQRPVMTVQRALAHPLRVRLVSELAAREASPVELARDLDQPLGVVSYHVRVLAEAGLLELSNRTFKRGAVQHHYRARNLGVISERLVLPAEEVESLLGEIRGLLEAAKERAGGEGVEVTAVLHRASAA